MGTSTSFEYLYHNVDCLEEHKFMVSDSHNFLLAIKILSRHEILLKLPEWYHSLCSKSWIRDIGRVYLSRQLRTNNCSVLFQRLNFDGTIDRDHKSGYAACCLLYKSIKILWSTRLLIAFCSNAEMMVVDLKVGKLATQLWK